MWGGHAAGANVVRKCGASVDDGPSVLFVVADLCDMDCSFCVTKVSVL